MILTAGFNVYPAEIERVLCGHPAVALAAVGGIPDETKGELAKAYVILKAATNVTREGADRALPRAPGCVQGAARDPVRGSGADDVVRQDHAPAADRDRRRDRGDRVRPEPRRDLTRATGNLVRIADAPRRRRRSRSSRKPAAKGTKASTTSSADQASQRFSDEELGAMKERAGELKPAARRGARRRPSRTSSRRSPR